MKLIVKEYEVQKKIYNVNIDPIDTYGKIDSTIGLLKGDLIIFKAEGDPRRFPSGTASGKVLMTDPSAELGWTIGDPDSTSSKLVNKTGTFVAAGSVVRLAYGASGGLPTFTLAPADCTTPVFITAEDSMDGDAITCYGAPGTIANVLCDTSAVTRGKNIAVTTIGKGGPATTASTLILGIALSAKAAGSAGLVSVLLTGTGTTPRQPQTAKVKTFNNQNLIVEDDIEYRSTSAGHNLVFTITLPAGLGTVDTFLCAVNFTSGSKFPGIRFRLSNAASDDYYEAKLIGDSITQKNKRYNLVIWWDGAYYWCVAKVA